MTLEIEASVYRLLGVPGLNERSLARVLTAWREEPALLHDFWGRPTEEYEARWRLSGRASLFLAGEADTDDAGAAQVLALQSRAAEIELLTLLDPAYVVLAAGRGLPPLLFTRGNQDLLWGMTAAVPHSKDASDEALAWGAALAAALAAEGVGPVTGHNRDGYRRAAAAAKRVGAPLTLILDRPLHGASAAGPGAEPVVTARLWDPEFRPERELIVSPFRPGEAWTPRHARGRDALIADFSTAVVAGGVRPGGTIARCCARAAAAGRLLFRSPYCRAELPGGLLPREVAAAAAVVLRELQRAGQSSGLPAAPMPGWMERRWESEVAGLVRTLALELGRAGSVRRLPADRIAAMEREKRQPGRYSVCRSVIQIPASPASLLEEVVVITCEEEQGLADANDLTAVLLAPSEPVRTLAALRHYFGRCRVRIGEMVRAQPNSASPAPGPSPPQGARPFP